MDTKDLIAQVRTLEFATRKHVSDLFAGNYKSSFKGKGIEFFGVREYAEGDEIRDIDWNVTAREGKPFVKKYTETRELTTMLAVDGSGSLLSGSRGMLKKDLLLRFCATIAFSAMKNNDKIGLIIFSDAIETYVPPAKGRKHMLRILRDLTEYNFSGKKTDYALAFTHVSKAIKKSALCFFVSDFLEPMDSYLQRIKVANARHDLIIVQLRDALDRAIPNMGLIAFEDGETGERYVVNAHSERLVKLYERAQERLFDENKKLLQKFRVASIEIATNENLYHTLFLFFKRRQHALR